MSDDDSAPIDQYDEMVRTEHLVLYIRVRQDDAGFWRWSVGQWDGYEMVRLMMWSTFGMAALERLAWEQARAMCVTKERLWVAWTEDYRRREADRAKASA